MDAVIDPIEQSQCFFAPVQFDQITSLMSRYAKERERIDELSSFFQDDGYRHVVSYFLDGNQVDKERRMPINVEHLFKKEGAIAALNASYWDRLLKMTDVLEFMPECRRFEWFEQIREHKVPEFEEGAVRDTLATLLANRAKFFSEQVDGIFRALSHEHVTNRPEGFQKRMILYVAKNKFGFICTRQAGHINDLRTVIAKLQGRPGPRWHSTFSIVQRIQATPGQWFDVDGGALRIRIYKKGTAHLEVHPDMAWRLNQILAFLYPSAIPSAYRTPKKRPIKKHRVMQQPLPYAVTEILADLKRTDGSGFDFYVPHIVNEAAGARERAVQVLASIGAEFSKDKHRVVASFDYDPRSIINMIVISGCIPDQKSHQFYPTPQTLAARAVSLANIGCDDLCLEPQAGQGNLASLMPLDRTTCIEISPLHCEVLRSKGFNAVQADFLTWKGTFSFDRVVMNPPFSLGRWQEHLLAAAGHLKPGGRLVAILPSGAKNKDLLYGWTCSWYGPFENEFPGTSINVVILVADKPYIGT